MERPVKLYEKVTLCDSLAESDVFSGEAKEIVYMKYEKLVK
jgi:hypothetical protein